MTIRGGSGCSGFGDMREDELRVSFLDEDLRTKARGDRLLGDALGDFMASKACADDDKSFADTL